MTNVDHAGIRCPCGARETWHTALNRPRVATFAPPNPGASSTARKWLGWRREDRAGVRRALHGGTILRPPPGARCAGTPSTGPGAWPSTGAARQHRTEPHQDRLGPLGEVAPRDTHDADPAGEEVGVPLPVSLEGGATGVELEPVELHREPHVGPVEVQLVGADLDVGQGVVDLGPSDELEEGRFELRSGEGRVILPEQEAEPPRAGAPGVTCEDRAQRFPSGKSAIPGRRPRLARANGRSSGEPCPAGSGSPS